MINSKIEDARSDWWAWYKPHPTEGDSYFEKDCWAWLLAESRWLAEGAYKYLEYPLPWEEN